VGSGFSSSETLNELDGDFAGRHLSKEDIHDYVESVETSGRRDIHIDRLRSQDRVDSDYFEDDLKRFEVKDDFEDETSTQGDLLSHRSTEVGELTKTEIDSSITKAEFITTVEQPQQTALSETKTIVGDTEHLVWLITSSIGALVFLNAFPIVGHISFMARRQLGNYLASAIILVLSGFMGQVITHNRKSLTHYGQAMINSQESNAFIIASSLALLSWYTVPPIFTLLHAISTRIPILGAIGVFFILIMSSVLLGCIALAAMAFHSWDITKIVHGGVVSLIKYMFGIGGAAVEQKSI
jgi:hypothetical protein